MINKYLIEVDFNNDDFIVIKHVKFLRLMKTKFTLYNFFIFVFLHLHFTLSVLKSKVKRKRLLNGKVKNFIYHFNIE